MSETERLVWVCPKCKAQCGRNEGDKFKQCPSCPPSRVDVFMEASTAKAGKA